MIVFLSMSLLPGDTATAILGPYATPENLNNVRDALGLDKPIIERYFIWLGNLFHGDFGHSYHLDRPVLDELTDRLGPTLLLGGSAFVTAIAVGLSAGVLTAIYQNSWIDRVATLLLLVGISTPSFWLALVFILLFSVYLTWFPISGMSSLYMPSATGDVLYHLLLPSVTLAVVPAGIIGRLTRTSMLEVLKQDYVRTAHAKGLKEHRVICVHAFKNAVVNVIPVIAVQIGFLLGGSVYVETIFQWPGIGRMLMLAISSRDILLVQGAVLIIAIIYVLSNLLADLVQMALNPRLRS